MLPKVFPGEARRRKADGRFFRSPGEPNGGLGGGHLRLNSRARSLPPSQAFRSRGGPGADVLMSSPRPVEFPSLRVEHARPVQNLTILKVDVNE